MKLEQRFVADEKSVVYKRTGLKGLLYRSLPSGAYDYLRGARLKLAQSPIGARLSLARARTYDALAQSGMLSGLYYAVGSRTFDREHKATLTAKAKYLRDVHTGDGNIFVLRRNVHKLEKALVMKPRRDIFALAFIHETVVSYADCVDRHAAGQISDTDTLEWSRQVLRVYFASISKPHAIVDEAKAIFDAASARAPGAEHVGDKARVPFARSTAELPSYDSLLTLAQQRRSVRWFDGRPVPRDLIDKAVLLAGLSPSACNRQPFRFAIFDDPALCQQVAAIPKGTPGWVHNIPCFVVIVGTLAAFDREKDRHIPYIDGSLAAMALCFALEAQGVSSCCVNWPDLAETEARMAKTLGLAKYERPIMCLAIGYPDMSEKVPYSQKLPLDELRSYNRAPGAK
jgi:nitroreductase